MVDIETAFYLWSSIVLIAALALFVEAVALIRFFLRHRRPWWQCLIALLPLSASVWSFIMAYQVISPFISVVPPAQFNNQVNFNYPTYLAWIAPYISAAAYDQRLLVICVGVFFITLVIERLLHVRYCASSQYTSNARSTSLSSTDAENLLQTMVFQSRKIH
jgi:hypothetical protein